MEEPSALIRWAIYLFAGGGAGRLAVIAIGAVAILFCRPNRTRLRPLVVGFIIFTGALLTFCSPVPVPDWFLLLTCLWLAAVIWQLRMRTTDPDAPIATRVGTSKRVDWQKLLLIGSATWLLIALGIEIPFLLFRSPTAEISDVLVIGDSITAGLNDGEDTWPQKLARETSVSVFDASQPGATLGSARKQNKLLAAQKGLVLLEIGGNDMLEGLAVRTFEQHLDQLLTEVTQAGRSIVMFELPLPPFSRGYGLAQRRQAKRHKVTLIPKGHFATVLTTRGATVDGIHLSAQGQQQMTRLIRSLFGKQLRPGSGNYERRESKVETTRLRLGQGD